MGITRKPKTQTSATHPVNVDVLIAKGGSVANESSPSTTDGEEIAITAFTMRAPNDILKLVEESRKKGAYKVPRQQWILEAIVQRLEREVGATPSKEG